MHANVRSSKRLSYEVMHFYTNELVAAASHNASSEIVHVHCVSEKSFHL